MKKPMKMVKKSPAKNKMPMTTVNGKKVPAFAADGKGASDMKKGSAATMKKKSMAKMAKKSPAKNKLGDLNKDGKMSGYESKRQAAIEKNMKNPVMMKKAAMKMKKESMAMLKKSAMMMKKASAMKMKMKKK